MRATFSTIFFLRVDALANRAAPILTRFTLFQRVPLPSPSAWGADVQSAQVLEAVQTPSIEKAVVDQLNGTAPPFRAFGLVQTPKRARSRGGGFSTCPRTHQSTACASRGLERPVAEACRGCRHARATARPLLRLLSTDPGSFLRSSSYEITIRSLALLKPVILCGGAGTRLWPVSRDSMPKQFVALTGILSSFQQTLERVADRSRFARPIVITNTDFRFIVAEQLREIGVEADIVLEPTRRESGPAVAAAAAL